MGQSVGGRERRVGQSVGGRERRGTEERGDGGKGG